MFELATHIFDGLFRDRLRESTVSADIAYVPSGFGGTVKALSTLARLKKDWDIDVIENDTGYVVMFEDKLKVSVAKEYMSDFVTRALRKSNGGKHSPKMRVVLDHYIAEGVKEDIYRLKKELRNKLNALISQGIIVEVMGDMYKWRRYAGTARIVPSVGSTVITYANAVNDVTRTYAQLVQLYGDDKGLLEMLVTALDEGRPLNSFNYFNEYDNMFAGRLRSAFGRTEIIFEVSVSMSMIAQESVFISDKVLAKEIEGSVSGVNAVNNVLFPQDKRFTGQQVERVWEYIEKYFEEEEDDDADIR